MVIDNNDPFMILILGMQKIYLSTTPEISAKLDAIENLRKDIVLTPLSSKIEQRLRWEATIDRIYYALKYNDIFITRKMIVSVLTGGKNKNAEKFKKKIISYKQGLDYLLTEWLMRTKNISFDDFNQILDLFSTTHLNNQENISPDKIETIGHIDNPVVQTAIAFFALLSVKATPSRILTVSIFAQTYLYKKGMNFRNFLPVEKIFSDLKYKFTQIKEKSGDNPADFIENFADSLIDELIGIKNNLSARRFESDLPANFWKLNSRQRKIILEFDLPYQLITNRDVRKLFRISKITASRDLSKLSQLGIIYPHGSGRSVHYTLV